MGSFGTRDRAMAADVDVAIVGAGFAGLYGLFELRRRGLTVRVLERGDDVGGTWYWNRYPGARCDIESVDYSYSFSPELRAEWTWTERYASQPEILAYLNHVADRFDLRRDIEFGCEVVSARFDESVGVWTVTSRSGEVVTARFCILATGNLSQPKVPDIPGLEQFEGDWHHTASWPQRPLSFAGKRVGLIGTGSSGLQVATELAKHDAELFVFQRTPSYSMPARNRPLTADERDEIERAFPVRRQLSKLSDSGVPMPAATTSALDVSAQQRAERYEAGWQRGGINALSYAFDDFFTSDEANRTAQDFARQKIRSIVRDPATAEALMPSYHIGTRRTCVDTGYYEIYNQDNVHLVDIKKHPIERIEQQGVLVQDRLVELDVIVFAVGFDAMTGAIAAIDVRGRDGRSLRDAWSAGPQTYLGLATSGFPNLFLVTGPGSPSVLSNMVVSIEQHIDWIADCLDWMHERSVSTLEVEQSAQDEWVAYVNELAAKTLYPAATSWYLGANIPGKPRVFMPYVAGVGHYRSICDRVAADDYRGFVAAPIPNRSHSVEEVGA